LVKKGPLCAVIDIDSSGAGDHPACDLLIVWVLWKGLITRAEHINTNPMEAEKARRSSMQCLSIIRTPFEESCFLLTWYDKSASTIRYYY
jgi:aminoglycoside phosphotransferase (APT) family kinase protein